jgi:hypothetical protein
MTSVVNVRDEECDVYIGRAWKGRPESKWHNPHRIGPDGDRSTVIGKYKVRVLNSPELMAALPELKDKVLGCWCNPLPCHGDVLVELVNKFTRCVAQSAEQHPHKVKVVGAIPTAATIS